MRSHLATPLRVTHTLRNAYATNFTFNLSCGLCIFRPCPPPMPNALLSDNASFPLKLICFG
jgi:hypothetical protein